MSDFTPGPWHMDPEEVTGGFRIVPKIGDRGLAVAIQRDAAPAIPGSGIDRETAEANARLIAAAPELLEALLEGRRAIGDHIAPEHCYATGPMTGNHYRDLVECPACSFIAMYDAAIAKATGGSA